MGPQSTSATVGAEVAHSTAELKSALDRSAKTAVAVMRSVRPDATDVLETATCSDVMASGGRTAVQEAESATTDRCAPHCQMCRIRPRCRPFFRAPGPRQMEVIPVATRGKHGPESRAAGHRVHGGYGGSSTLRETESSSTRTGVSLEVSRVPHERLSMSSSALSVRDGASNWKEVATPRAS